MAEWALGLPIFVVIATDPQCQFKARCVAATVVLNGILCHGAYTLGWLRSAWWFRAWDIACNVVAVGYVNTHTSVQPWTAFMSLVGGLAFCVNQRTSSAAIHTAFVAQPLVLARMAFNRSALKKIVL